MRMQMTYGKRSLECLFLALLLAIAVFAAAGFVLLAFAIRAGGKIGFVSSRKVLGKRRFLLGILRIAREILPLVWIGRFVVEFFVPVGVANVAPPLAADGVVAFLVRRHS